MAFTLDTPSGKGSKTVKISADKNNEDSQKTAQLLVQVNGVTKQVVQLVQMAASNYKVFINTSVDQVGAIGGNVRVTYWATLNGNIVDDLPVLEGTKNVINRGTGEDGKHWVIDKLPVNFGSVNYTVSFNSAYANATVTQRPIKVRLTADDSYIPGEGGVTNLRYWYEDGSDIGSENLELIFDSEGSDQGVQYTLGAPNTDSTGKIVRIITLPANTVNVIKTLKFYTKHSLVGTVSNTIELLLAGKDMTVLPDFDFFVFNYEWSEDNGKDLDSATMVLGSHIPIDSTRELDDFFVGYGGNGKTVVELEKFILHGGDNTQSGAEGAMINWKEICNRDLISQGITKLQAKIYGNWYKLKSMGNMRLVFKTYKGTNMIKDGFVFVPGENTVLVSESSFDIHCLAFSSENSTNGRIDRVYDYYSLLAMVEYDVISKSAVIYPYTPNSGRSIESDIIVSDGVEENDINFDGTGYASLPVEFGLTSELNPKDLSFLNAREVVKTVDPINQVINVLNQQIGVFKYEVPEDATWITVQPLGTDENGYITGIRCWCEDNNTGASRSASVNLYVGRGENMFWTRSKSCKLTLLINQSKFSF